MLESVTCTNLISQRPVGWGPRARGRKQQPRPLVHSATPGRQAANRNLWHEPAPRCTSAQADLRRKQRPGVARAGLVAAPSPLLTASSSKQASRSEYPEADRGRDRSSASAVVFMGPCAGGSRRAWRQRAASGRRRATCREQSRRRRGWRASCRRQSRSGREPWPRASC